MLRIFVIMGTLWFITSDLFGFNATFPDSPVIITELPPTITFDDRSLTRTLVRDSRNNLYVVYSITNAIRVSRSTDNGIAWNVFAAPGTQIDWRDGLHSPCIGIDRGDTIYVAWERDYTDSLIGGVEAIYWSKYNGRTWTLQEPLTQDYVAPPAGWPTTPSLALDAQNRAHIAYSGGRNLFGAYTIAYTYLRPNGLWNWPIEDVGEHPNGDADDCEAPNLFGDGMSNLHLGYVYYWNGVYLFARYRKRPAGGPWGPIEDLSIWPWDSISTSPSLATVPGNEQPHATLTVGAPFLPPGNHSRIFYRFKRDTSWNAPTELIPFHEYWYPGFVIITADRQGHLYVAWEYAMTYLGGNVVARNIWMREQEYAPWWREPFKVTSDTIIPGVYPSRLNDYPGLGYPVTENGVDITWMRTTYDTLTGQHYYLMYHRLPSLLGVEQEKEKAPPREPEITLSPRPNPARGAMELTYGIPASSQQETVNLTIYNIVGERVRTLVHGPTPAGVYRVRWNGKDERLKEAPSGTYFIQLTVGEKQVIKKGTFIR